MSLSVKTAVVFGFKLYLKEQQVNFLKEETALNVFPVSYREDEPTGQYLVGEIVAELNNVDSSGVCNIEGLEAIEPQIVKILKDMGIEVNTKAQVLVTSYYW